MLKQHPRRMRQAGGNLATPLGWKIGDHIVEFGMGLPAIEKLEQVRAQKFVFIVHITVAHRAGSLRNLGDLCGYKLFKTLTANHAKVAQSSLRNLQLKMGDHRLGRRKGCWRFLLLTSVDASQCR